MREGSVFSWVRVPKTHPFNTEALLREESRGAHHREDFPEESEAWRKNILCARDDGGGGMHLWTEPVAEVPAEIRKALDED